jgi:uncharacterized membrane protein
MTDLQTPPTHDTLETSGKDPAYLKVLALYIGFLFVVLFQFPLAPLIQVVSVILLFVLVSCIGFIRKESEKDSYIYNHATFLSRTLWMWSFMLTLTVILAGVYIGDAVQLSLEDVQTLSQDVMNNNLDTPIIRRLLPVAIFTMAPSTLYIFWRYILGITYAIKGNFLKRPKSFF